MLRYLNGGESHGKGLIAILEGMPSGVPLTADDINRDLARRQKGYGRGGRMRIEQDRVEFLSGVRKGFTLGTPITLHVANRDWENWKEIMAPEPGPPVTEKSSPVHALAMPIWSGPSSTTIAISETCWRRPARGKPRSGWRSVASPNGCWPNSASRCIVTRWKSAG